VKFKAPGSETPHFTILPGTYTPHTSNPKTAFYWHFKAFAIGFPYLDRITLKCYHQGFTVGYWQGISDILKEK